MATRAIILVVGLVALAASAASADPAQPPPKPPSADLARKCRELSVKAHPPTVAGSTKGDASEERAYFAACLKNGGEPDK